jgi:hypothetical protein
VSKVVSRKLTVNASSRRVKERKVYEDVCKQRTLVEVSSILLLKE